MGRLSHPRIQKELASRGQLRDVRLTVAGRVPKKREWVHRVFDICAVGLVVRGRGTYRVGDAPVREIVAGDVFSVYPGPTFDYGPAPGTAWDEYHVGGVGPGTRRWLDAGWVATDGAVRRIHRLAEAKRRFELLSRLVSRPGPGDTDRAVLAAERLLLELSLDAAGSREPDRVDAALEALRHRHAEVIDWDALAAAHGMSESLLRRRCRERTGLPPAKYLTHLRCEEATRLLAMTDRPIHEIAELVGYGDPFTFSKAFKRTVGIAPEPYRQHGLLRGT